MTSAYICVQVAESLALACAMDLRSALDAARTAASRRSLAGLVADVTEPLRTLRTLGAMLAPRLEQEDVQREMLEGMVQQVPQL